ncbi:MAG: DNA helicase, partial [Planctomycetes bacterium]|nr:DNA helicase [Planctomycetota bacterium]
ALAVAGADAPALQAALTARIDALRLFVQALRIDEAALVRWLDGRSLTAAVVESLPRWRSDANAAFLGLVRWCKLQARLAPLDAAGFGSIRTAALAGAIRADQAIEALDRSVARACVDERRRALGFQRFDGKEHGTRVQRHATLHTDESKALTQVLPVKLLGTRPFGPGERKGVVGELRRKDLERARPRSIRALLDDYADAVLALTPCVLASPDSVAQFLVPGVIEFDLVVFDEASQVPVADAIGAIGRGKAVVIVGDSQQMPPTAFFARTTTAAADDEAPVEEDTPDMDSILTEARNDGIKPILLSWHYRSQDESLIAFSNRHYYDSRLSSFPAPTQRADGKGLTWIKVADGVFDSAGGRVNAREAAALVAEVRRRLADPVESKRSIGIVTMNLTQAELVRDLLEAAAEHDEPLRRALDDESEDRLFVKNLENVQGDERDVILIGTTYGKGPDGRMRMQFGPLGKAGGEKRWNVLVTRARQQVVVVSSMEPEDIRTHDVSASATGVHHMRAYLEMCKRGVGNSLESRVRPVEAKDLHREDVAAALRQRGLHVETNVGLSSFKVDLAVADPADPGRRLVAVLLDGPGYAARRTVQDRDALPVSVLQRMMGWPVVCRVWLPEWLLERDRVLDEIAAACAEARSAQAQSALLRAATAGRAAAA